MGTLLQFRDQLKAKRPEIKGNSNFPDAWLTRLVNDSQRFVQVNLAHLGIKKWEATDALTLSAGAHAEQTVKTANLATDCPNRLFDGKDAIKHIECGTTSGGGNVLYGIAKYIDDDLFSEQLRNTYLAPTLSQPVFTRINNLIYLAPSTITLATASYYKAITELSADGDLTAIPEVFEEFIVKKALTEIDEILGKINEKQVLVNELTSDIRKTFESMGLAKADEMPQGMKL
jgi:hypothetical protein